MKKNNLIEYKKKLHKEIVKRCAKTKEIIQKILEKMCFVHVNKNY
jgi:hypothetical protein